MANYLKWFTREDVMQGLVKVSGTCCDFECVIMAECSLQQSQQQHQGDEGIYAIDYHSTRALKNILRIQMVDSRHERAVSVKGQGKNDDRYWREWLVNSNLNPNAKEFIPKNNNISNYNTLNRNILDLVVWLHVILDNLKIQPRDVTYECKRMGARVDPSISASIEKVNDWFDVLEAQGVSFFEEPDLYEAVPEEPIAVITSQSICPEELFREYRRRMEISLRRNVTAECNYK